MRHRLPVLAALTILLLAGFAVWTGQGSMGHQQLPSPWDTSSDDVQYFPGPDDKLIKHIEASKAAARARQSR